MCLALPLGCGWRLGAPVLVGAPAGRDAVGTCGCA